MASSLSVMTPATNQHHMDRLDAARALLGVSPSTEPSSPNTSRLSTSFGRPFQPQKQTAAQHSQESRFPLTASLNAVVSTRSVTFEKPQVFPLAPPAVISHGLQGLDALAALASSEQAHWEQQQQQQQQKERRTVSNDASASSSSDEEAMPPPAPRRGRPRSISNPEGMEKWARPSRRDFVLPASILEEELAEASAAMEEQQRKNSADLSLVAEEEEEEETPEDGSSTQQPAEAAAAAPISGLMSEEEQANLTPEELLKRARSRLLEDLSEGSLNGEKGVLTLPHSLSKYKEVYNKNGRIGIYTPAERAAIIARFNHKRSRRVWNKKIRYNCRKNLADRRMRVKGRFVKRSTEQEAKPKEEEEHGDQDMPDVTDPEAGFCPTEDQPYRRTRRHTIT